MFRLRATRKAQTLSLVAAYFYRWCLEYLDANKWGKNHAYTREQSASYSRILITFSRHLSNEKQERPLNMSLCLF